MKIIRWFLSHFILILLIVAVIYGYMFWGNLLGDKTPGGKALAYLSSEFVEVEDFINAVKAKQAQRSSQQAPAEQAQAEQSPEASENTGEAEEDKVSAPAVVAETETPADTKAEAARDITQQPVSISYSHNQMRVKQNSIGEIELRSEAPAAAEVTADTAPAENAEAEVEVAPVVPQAVPAEPETVVAQRQVAEVSSQPVISEAPVRPVQPAVEAKPVDKFVPAHVERQLNNVDKNGKVIDPALKGYAIRESWVMARKSFYQRRYELSEQSYREVINNTTDNFDAYGELGNVYFNQGKNAEAAEAYFEAASILVRTGQVSRARSLMGLLRHLDKSKAADLQKLIDSAAS